MLSQIGFYSLVSMVLLNGINVLSILIDDVVKRNRIINFCTLFAFFAITISFISLVGSYIVSDFSNYNVFLHP